MLCPKCNCENVKIHREKIGNVSGNKGVYAKKKHGILYWTFVGWWIWILHIYSDILTLGYTRRKRKQNSIHQVGSYHQTDSLWHTVAICQNCGYTWETSRDNR